MASLKPPPSAPSSVIPDLDISASPSRRSESHAKTKDARANRAAGSSFGNTDNLDADLWGSGSNGSLELEGAERHSGATLAQSDPTSEPWPTGTTPAPGSLPIDNAEVDRLCTWGPTPKSWWQTVPYAFEVTLARRGLLAEIQAVNQELSKAEQLRDQSLSELGQQLMEPAAAEPRLHPAVASAKARIGEYARLAEQQSVEKDDAGAEAKALEQNLVDEQQQLQGLQSQLKHCQGDVEIATLNLKREQARLQRLDIERRNLEQSNAQSPELSAKVEALSLQAQSLAAPIEAAKRALSASQAALQRIEASAERTRQNVYELERRKDAHIRAQSLRLRETSSLFDNALAGKNEALADLGRGILTGNGRIAVDQGLLAPLRKHDEDIGVLFRRQQVFVHAFDSYHRDSVKTGLTLCIGSLVLFVVGLLWRIFT